MSSSLQDLNPAQAYPAVQRPEETQTLVANPVLWTATLDDLTQAESTLHRYPEEEYEDARRKLNLRTGWPREQLWLGRTTAEALLFILECLAGPDRAVWIQPDHPYEAMLRTQLTQRQIRPLENPENQSITLAFSFERPNNAFSGVKPLWHVTLNPSVLDATDPTIIAVWELPTISLNPIPPVFGVCIDPTLPQVLRAVTEPFHIPTHLLRRLDSELPTLTLFESAMAPSAWIPHNNSEEALAAILPCVRGIQPYVPGKGIRTMSKIMGLPTTAFSKLASNEHPTGVRTGVVSLARQILESWQQEHTNYAQAADQLRQALIEHLQKTTASESMQGQAFSLHSGQIHLGTGSVDLIKATIQGLLPLPGQTTDTNNGVLSPKLPFAMYPFEVTKRAGHYLQLDLAEGYQTPVNELISHIQGNAPNVQKPSVIFLANPRNPLGTGLENVDAIIEALDDTQVLILDEAYIDFIRYEMGAEHYPDGVGLLHRYPDKRLLLLRTFSKSYAIAACRLGYAITSQSLSEAVANALLPCTVDPVSLAVGIASLQAPNGKEWSEETARLVQEQKERFYQLFNELSLVYVRSYANFVYFETRNSKKSYTGQTLFDHLVKQGVIIRPVLEGSARVSVGKPDENTAFINAMRSAYH